MDQIVERLTLVIPNSNARLHITTTGEALRGLVSLRLKEYDRQVLRVEGAIEFTKKELLVAEADVKDETRRSRRGRTGRLHVSPLGGLRSNYLPSPANLVLGNITNDDDEDAQAVAILRHNVDHLEQTLAGLRHGKSQAQWLHDQIRPSESYEIGTADLAMLGFSGAMHGLPALVHNVDPLVL